MLETQLRMAQMQLANPRLELFQAWLDLQVNEVIKVRLSSATLRPITYFCALCVGLILK